MLSTIKAIYMSILVENKKISAEPFQRVHNKNAFWLRQTGDLSVKEFNVVSISTGFIYDTFATLSAAIEDIDNDTTLHVTETWTRTLPITVGVLTPKKR